VIILGHENFYSPDIYEALAKLMDESEGEHKGSPLQSENTSGFVGADHRECLHDMSFARTSLLYIVFQINNFYYKPVRSWIPDKFLEVIYLNIYYRSARSKNNTIYIY